MMSQASERRPGPPLTEGDRRFWDKFHGPSEVADPATEELVEDVGHMASEEFLEGHEAQGPGE